MMAFVRPAHIRTSKGSGVPCRVLPFWTCVSARPPASPTDRCTPPRLSGSTLPATMPDRLAQIRAAASSCSPWIFV